MPDYDWREWDTEPWRVRYPESASGARTWVIIFSASPNRGEMDRWVPHEYGRVKHDALKYRAAACRTTVHPADTAQFAEYFHLGVVARSLDEVRSWLDP